MFNDNQNGAMSQPPLPSSLYQPAFSPPPAPPSATSNASNANPVPSFPFSSGPTNAFSSVSSAHFALPPTTTLFTDHIQALSSSAAPSAFYSSYGLYQPVQGPYARFLTPSPEPSVLGDFELEIELENLAAANAAAGNGWNDGEAKEEAEGGTRDPFAGMTIAPSRPTSPKLEQDAFETNPRPVGAYSMFNNNGQQQHGQYESYGDGSFGGEAAGNGAGEAGPSYTDSNGHNEWEARNGDSDAESKDVKASTAAKGKGKAKPKAPRKPRQKKGAAAAAGGDGTAAAAAATEKANSKKNRNPHATQLPGGAGPKKREAGDGHEGPVCTHCGSVTTPLWRRGPDDELLCNAWVPYPLLRRSFADLPPPTAAVSIRSCTPSLDQKPLPRRPTAPNDRRTVQQPKQPPRASLPAVSTAARRVRRCGGRTRKGISAVTLAVSIVSWRFPSPTRRKELTFLSPHRQATSSRPTSGPFAEAQSDGGSGGSCCGKLAT